MSIELALKYAEERKHNFATVDPETCEHKLVYHKGAEWVHCHFCDKPMYREKDEEHD